MNVLLTEALAVLAEAGKPVHYRELTQRMLNRGIWTTSGKTPEATVNAQISVSIKKLRDKSPFERVGPGLYTHLVVTGQLAPVSQDQSTAVDPPTHEAASDTESRRTTLSFTDAAEQVLDQYGNQSPMHYREITTKILSLDLVGTQGRTPEATLYSQIMSEIERSQKRGDTSRYVRIGRGYFGLTKWNRHGLRYQVDQHNDRIKKTLRQQLLEMHPADFEVLIGQLLDELGFADVVVTNKSGDGGIDVRGTLVVGEVIRTNMAVQVKRWKGNVQAPTVQQVRGSLGTHDQGLIITTSDFSSGARAEAARTNATPVALMNGEQLVNLLASHQIGVARTEMYLLDIADPALDE
ncbi:MAG: HTH domain-containing protein [Chloroflexota bacterium]|nr:HTH domain-containing protein [Chloroflexota bacterium]